jgi:adenosylcobinamide-GDP ribazoletransferase
MRFFRRLLLALQFMTRLPLPFDAKAEEKDFAGASMFYPLTSLVVGAFAMLAFWLASFLGEALLAAFIAVLAGFFITGALHLDGFADCCDAFFARKSREETLRILKDSHIGVYGTLGVLADTGLKTLLLYALCKQGKTDMLLAVLCTPVAGKLALIAAPVVAGYAREQGTGKSMIGQMRALYIIVCAIFSAIILALFFKINAAFIVPALLLCGLITAMRAKRKIGGITGDVLGAANEIGEMLFLAALLLICIIRGG